MSDSDSDSDLPELVNGDDSHLSTSQTEILLHFQQISGIEDLDECRLRLESSDWDLEQATNTHFHIGQSSVSSTASASAATVTPSSPPPVTLQADQVRVIRPAHNLSWLSWFRGLVYFPFRFLNQTFTSLIHFFLSFLRSDGRRALTDPAGDVRNFINRFEEEFGRQHPPVFNGSYGQALDTARRELQFMLVYLHAESHQDTSTFCSSVLVSQQFTDFINTSQCLFWMCSVNVPEGARVSQALRETAYPFLALIVLKNGKMTVVARFEGLLTGDRLVAELNAAIADYEPYIREERAKRENLAWNRRLIEEQDQAFAEALAKDREKERKKQEEAHRKNEEVALAERQAAEKAAELEKFRLGLPEEPPLECTEPTVKLIVRLPGGERLERRFRLQDPVKYLYYFVRLNGNSLENFSLTTNFPRREIPCGQADMSSFQDAGLTQSEMLFVIDND